MDGSRFDDLLRSWSASPTRRGGSGSDELDRYFLDSYPLLRLTE